MYFGGTSRAHLSGVSRAYLGCISRISRVYLAQAFTLLEERHRAKARLRARRGRKLPTSTYRKLQTTISPIYPTCVDSYMTDYLNLPEVQA